jgi:transposase
MVDGLMALGNLLSSLSQHRLRNRVNSTKINLKLHTVLSDLTGRTGRAIIRSILKGERDPERLAIHRDPRCHASHVEMVAALTGNYRAEHLFALKHNFAAYNFLLQQITPCDSAIEAVLLSIA